MLVAVDNYWMNEGYSYTKHRYLLELTTMEFASKLSGTGLPDFNSSGEWLPDDSRPSAANSSDGGPPGEPPHGPPMPVYVTIVVYVLMILIGSIGNIATIVAFVLDIKLRSKPSDLIILALAIADVCICVFIIPLELVESTLRQWIFGDVLCKISIFLQYTCTNAGVNLIVILSWDRYLMLAKEYGDYIRIQTRKRIICLILMAWICALIPAIVENALWTYFNDLYKLIVTDKE